MSQTQTNVGTPTPRPSTQAKTRKPRLAGGLDISFTTCVKTLSNVTISRRGLLNLELAVGLAVFLDAGVADRNSKGLLVEVYQGAGYQCTAAGDKDYKTVNRRIAASAALFGKIGMEVVNHWAEGAKETKLLQAFAHHLGEFNFNSMDDVLDYVGRTSNRTRPAAAPKQDVGDGGVETKVGAETMWDIHVGDDQGGVDVHLPPGLTEAQLIELAHKILTLADTVREDILKAGQGVAAVSAAAWIEGQSEERRHEAVQVDPDRRVH